MSQFQGFWWVEICIQRNGSFSNVMLAWSTTLDAFVQRPRKVMVHISYSMLLTKYSWIVVSCLFTVFWRINCYIYWNIIQFLSTRRLCQCRLIVGFVCSFYGHSIRGGILSLFRINVRNEPREFWKSFRCQSTGWRCLAHSQGVGGSLSMVAAHWRSGMESRILCGIPRIHVGCHSGFCVWYCPCL